jgi:hypothetical protein
MAIRRVFLVDGLLALGVPVQAWGDICDIGRDDQIWWDWRKDDTGCPHTAPTPVELHKMTADDHAFFPVRRAS